MTNFVLIMPPKNPVPEYMIPFNQPVRAGGQVGMYSFYKKLQHKCKQHLLCSSWERGYYWVVQAGLLTPLSFTWHHLSPLAVFTSSAYFLHNRRRWQWICKVYSANFKDIFEGP